jgi:hypothetical protein
MRPTPAEIEYLSAWAREEWEPDCYHRPAHRLQLAHGVRGADLIDFIKAWTQAEGKPDQAILDAACNSDPAWPWKSNEEFEARRSEVQELSQSVAPGARN